MSSELTTALINNAALLLALSIIFEISYIFRIRNKLLAQVLSGVLIGLIGIAIMSMPYELVPGVFYDTRSILLCVTALIFGFCSASIATLIMIAYRFVLGGAGLLPGVSMIVVTAALGLLARRLIDSKSPKWRWLKLYAFGLCVHVVYLVFTFMMPWETAVRVIREITFPILAIYPVGVLLLSQLLIIQKEHNEALIEAAEAESRYKNLFDNNPAVMLLIDPADGRIVDANPAAASFYGWSVDTLKSMYMSQVCTMEPAETQEDLKKSLEYGEYYNIYRDRTASGRIVDVEVYSGPIEVKGYSLLNAIIHDVTSRTEALKALQESEERFRTVVDNAPDAIFVMLDMAFAYANKAGLRLLGAEKPEDLIGLPGISVIHPDYLEDTAKYMEKLHEGSGVPPAEERVYIRLDKVLVHVEAMVVPIRYNNRDGDLVFARDITERKLHQQKEQELEAQLRQQQKLEAIGTLAGGVAHEINNPLNGIMNYAQLILDGSEADSDRAEYAREIIHETERISTIVRNLLQFSRHEKKTHSCASIYDIVGQTISLVNTVINKDQITLDISLDENLPDIKCRSQQIQQVFMNLLTNAKDAVNERYQESSADKNIRVRCSEYNDGKQWLRLTVTDNGCGIPPDMRDRIFEPFFSTKPKESGTGLGLSISYGIVSEHRGRLSFESEPGEYTTFILDLPVDNGWTLDTEQA